MLKNMNRRLQAEWLWIISIALLTAIGSEIKLSPFSGEHFRFGMGAIIFFFMLLIRAPKSVVKTGIITGLVTVVFRIIIDTQFLNISIEESLLQNYPAFIFYFVYACGFRLLNLANYIDAPFKLGALAIIVELISNSAEHFLRLMTVPTDVTNWYDLFLVLGVAILRSYFVVGLYSSIMLNEQKKRIEQKLFIDSGLYVEMMYLNKSMNHIEQITAQSYELYRELKNNDLKPLSRKALHISQEIHEVKKDAQRIVAGLSQITIHKEDEYYLLSEVIDLIIVGNMKYSELLKKDIEFNITRNIDFQTVEQIPLMAILNNIVANGIEAIGKKGIIKISIEDDQENVYFNIYDSGKGIPQEDIDIVFEPGYTTKFNDLGVAATGIGLSHVKEVIQNFGGNILIERPAVGTVFHIMIPKNRILKGDIMR